MGDSVIELGANRLAGRQGPRASPDADETDVEHEKRKVEQNSCLIQTSISEFG